LAHFVELLFASIAYGIMSLRSEPSKVLSAAGGVQKNVIWGLSGDDLC
jgi:hypothetical protein